MHDDIIFIVKEAFGQFNENDSHNLLLVDYMFTWSASFLRLASFCICWMSPTARPIYAWV